MYEVKLGFKKFMGSFSTPIKADLLKTKEEQNNIPHIENEIKD